MLSSNAIRLLTIFLACNYSLYALYTVSYRTHVSTCNVFKQTSSSCSITSIDEIPESILSLLSSNTTDGGSKTKFLMQCRYEYSNNRRTLSEIDQFEENYRSEQAISWYTRDSFVYRIINKSLRSGNIRQVNKCRYFIQDLHQQLTDLHRTKYRRDIVQPTQIFYRGMTLYSEDIKRLIVGEFITFNSFMSASSSKDVAMMFAANALLQIEVNNRTGLHAVFHQISDLSNFKQEDEILFSIGNIFRVEKIQWCDKKLLWYVKLTLQKDLQHRLDFRIQSTNNIKQKLISFSPKRIWHNIIKPFSSKMLNSLISSQSMLLHFHKTKNTPLFGQLVV
jgi:hypothetical protein